MNIRDRVIDQRKVPASSLRPSPLNWRTHPKEQRDALRGVLAEIGFAGSELVRQLEDGTLELIDGHLRAEELGDQLVAVTVTDLTDKEAKKLLVVFDPLSAMAGADEGLLESLLGEIETQSPALQAMLDQLAQQFELDSEESEEDGEEPAGVDAIPEKFQILIDFEDEHQQSDWLGKLTSEGLQCRSLIS